MICYINRFNMGKKRKTMKCSVTKRSTLDPKKQTHLRSPRLSTILMVENFIKKHDAEFKKRKLWESLPKKMMYQTYCTIIDYLYYSLKISVDAEGKIGWIHYPEKTNYYVKRKDLSWRKPSPS
jgi:hypothetical protein